MADVPTFLKETALEDASPFVKKFHYRVHL